MKKKLPQKFICSKETTLKLEKKLLALVLPYLGSMSLQTRTKLKTSLKTNEIVVVDYN